MKTLLFLLLLLSISAKAQTWDEWFKQRKTQHKYMLQQIAGLKVYIEYAQKGYSIIKDGLNTISQIKNGDLKLHQVFFDGLKSVNPKIKAAGRIPQLMAMDLEIRKYTSKATQTSYEITPTESGYVSRVFNRVNQNRESIIEEMDVLLSDNKLEMNEDQRIKRLNLLYEQMVDAYLFTRSFCDGLTVLSAQRKRESMNINNTTSINGLNH